MKNDSWRKIVSSVVPTMTNIEFKNTIDFFEQCEKKVLSTLKDARENPKKNKKRIDALSAEAIEIRANLLALQEVRV